MWHSAALTQHQDAAIGARTKEPRQVAGPSERFSLNWPAIAKPESGASIRPRRAGRKPHRRVCRAPSVITLGVPPRMQGRSVEIDFSTVSRHGALDQLDLSAKGREAAPPHQPAGLPQGRRQPRRWPVPRLRRGQLRCTPLGLCPSPRTACGRTPPKRRTPRAMKVRGVTSSEAEASAVLDTTRLPRKHSAVETRKARAGRRVAPTALAPPGYLVIRSRTIRTSSRAVKNNTGSMGLTPFLSQPPREREPADWGVKPIT